MAESFRDALESLINCHSMERGSDTPDFILARYLDSCLKAYDTAVCEREKWYSRPCGQGAGIHPKVEELVGEKPALVVHPAPIT